MTDAALNSQNEIKRTTKEKIFDAAVDLFSLKGFSNVPVREIAKKAGIREGSIYNHFRNKEAILDAIIDYFKLEMAKTNLPSEEAAALMQEGPEVYLEMGAQIFLSRINTPQFGKIWRLVLMESYHNEKIRDVFKKDLIEEPLAGWESIFQLMVEKKMIKPVNPRIMAYEYWSFVIFLLFDYSILYYEQDFGSYMKGGLEKMNNHTRLLLEAVKIRDKQSQLKF
ncbi:TetR/AcrR family transcriptional regulator [Methanobacterium sp. CWC-01]|uniref:TetR/AcrR family transcriptional regulator n=1 Tax=Methanobacterium aridiramus TaxID=2584467 RepID=UPI002576A7FD|nr:TetR/AcrR family transcriptional regulator [Methanobacterium sp. CWC-01]WJI08620.1 TetR/AcrR family transcriptional regulator [Methanobacterium sp. CWC-01]